MQATHTIQNEFSRIDKITTYVLALGFILLYLVLKSEFHTYDSIDYFFVACHGENLWNHFHPHHLLYHLLLLAVHKLTILIHWIPEDPFLPFVLPAAVFGGLTVGAIFLLGRRIMDYRWALASALGAGFSFSMIFMSTDVEKYSISVFFLLLALHFVMRQESFAFRNIMIVGVCLALASLIHQAAFMFIVFLGVLILFEPKSRTIRWRNITVLTIIAVLMIVMAYTVVGWIHPNIDQGGSLAWSMSYPASGVWGNGFSEPVSNWLEGQYASVAGFLFNEALNPKLAKFSPVKSVVTAMYPIILAFAIMGIMMTRLRRLSAALLVWVLSYVVFIVWWEPANTKVAVLYIPGLWLLLSYGMSRFAEKGWKKLDRLVLVVMFVFIACVANINVTRAYRRSVPGVDVCRATSEYITRLTTAADLIIAPCNSTVDRYLIAIYGRAKTVTLISILKNMKNRDQFSKVIDDSFQKLCKKPPARVFICGYTCDPVGKDPPGPLSNKDIRYVMLPLLKNCRFISDLPNGDRLFEMDLDAICLRYQ